MTYPPGLKVCYDCLLLALSRHDMIAHVPASIHLQGEKRMRVFLAPSSGDGSLAPAPTNPAVALSVAGGEMVAVQRFDGSATQQACERARQKLLVAVGRAGLRLGELEAAGTFRLAQYGPLHSLSPRLNEIWIAVELQ